MHPSLEPVLALAGLTGVAFFALGKLAARQCHIPVPHPGTTQIALYLGLTTWIALSVLRHDVVTAVGLLLAMLLLHRRHRYLVRMGTRAERKQATLPRSKP